MREGTLPRASALVTRSDPGFGARVIGVGVGVTVGLAVAGAAYTALTWERPHRAVLLTVSVLALADALAIWLLRDRLGASDQIDAIFAAWNVAHIFAAGIASALDGGPTSPYTTVLFVSVAFAAVSLPRPYLVTISAIDIAVLFGIAIVTGHWPTSLIFMAPALAAVSFVCAAIAGERYARLIAVEDARAEMLQRLARVIEFRDLETGNHVERMSEYARLIAERLGWSTADAERLRAAAQMHDIGKIAVPDSILLKPGPLTEAERIVMQRHTVVGSEMLSGSSSAELALAAEIALSHHERFDGTGYPNGLAGEAIPLAGRIVAVADVFDALTSDRIYRLALPLAEALETIRESRGTQFDPRVLDAFEDSLDEILAARDRHSEPGPAPFVTELRSSALPI